MAVLKKTPLIAVTMGDPAGIGPEVILKAVGMLARRPGAPNIVVVGDLDVMDRAARAARIAADAQMVVHRQARSPPADGIGLLESSRLGDQSPPLTLKPNLAGGQASFDDVAQVGEDGAERTGRRRRLPRPSAKNYGVNRAGHHFPGHLRAVGQKLSHTRTWRMMFAPGAAPAPASRLPPCISDSPRFPGRSLATASSPRSGRSTIISSARPSGRRRAFPALGLNPHAGENGLFGDEESKQIAPAITRSRREGIDVDGPLAPIPLYPPGRSFGFDGRSRCTTIRD